MVFGVVIGGPCKCCQKSLHSGEMWHCKDCWDKYHNGARDGDWEDYDTYMEKHGELEKQVREEMRVALLRREKKT